MNKLLKMAFVLSLLVFNSQCMNKEVKEDTQLTQITISKEEIPAGQVGLLFKYFRFDQPVSRGETKKSIEYLQCARNEKEEQLHLLFMKSNHKIYWRRNKPSEMSAASYLWFVFLEQQYKKQTQLSNESKNN